jgi:hypothetical protein
LLRAFKPFRLCLRLAEKPAYDKEVNADDAKSPGYDQKFDCACHNSPLCVISFDFAGPTLRPANGARNRASHTTDFPEDRGWASLGLADVQPLLPCCFEA